MRPSARGCRRDVALIDQISNYIISAGGKRIRPRLVLLFAQALGFEGRERYELAAIVEFIHTATLLHDDVVDESSLRRGRADGQRDVRQCRQRAGRRLPLFPRLPDDGVGEPHARARGAGRRHQRHRRRRGAAADEHARRRSGGGRLPARHPLQDGQAVRGQRPPGRGLAGADTDVEECLRRLRPLAGHRLPTGRRPARLRGRPACSWARTSATTCARASRRCRC